MAVQINELDVRSSLRTALRVRRYHVWPMLQEQSVGEHTAQVLGAYWCVFGPPAPEVTTAILLHDAGEGDAGDNQYGAKRRYPELKAALDVAEAAQVRVVVDATAGLGADPHPQLTDRERWRVKACDLLDGWEHALTDVAMGNRLALPVVDAYASGLEDHLLKMPDDDRARVRTYCERPWAKKLVKMYHAARRIDE